MTPRDRITQRIRPGRGRRLPHHAACRLAIAVAALLTGLPLRHAAAQTVEITVIETIGVADAVEALPPVVVDVSETIGVTDDPAVFPPVVLDVAETIGVTDALLASAFDPDADDDGVDDVIEDAAPNGGDGNGDGIADALQADVASLPGPGGDYVTLALAPGCAGLLAGPVVAESAVPGDPLYDYPFGLLDFRLACAHATVTALFHAATSLAAPYRGYGPTTPGSPETTAWYTLPSASFGSATVGGSSVAAVTLVLVDGALGDETGVDGEILGFGGPGVLAATAIPVFPAVAWWMLGLAIAGSSGLALGSWTGFRRGTKRG